ncbi:hypothetical protein HG536_0A06100 [Torulaspora globosa]|uniref:DUF3020 domain-containing protein n=1 Tax=Torulaspora globosa TaxID=48254 RepID=A0A7G3ZBA9_9SACH|nr:uncharacterized protein HG536_0A06100 [Torulaspora globosa]QLL30795.1 hypothetical protein HG536_0A06100 [Torulaspora globosa]
MSEDHADEINFNELVGNLLSSHNASEQHVDENVDAGEVVTSFDHHQQDADHTGEDSEQQHLGEELPEFGDGEGDDALAAVVASAIQSMDHEEQNEEGEADRVPREDTSRMDRENEEHQQDRPWANMLQQSVSQGTEAGKSHTEDQLDQDDETLRQAILESLSELNNVEKEANEHVKEVKERPKKSSKKKKNKDKERAKDKHNSAKKKKHHNKEKEVEGGEDNLLDFEDVIKGFMRQGNEQANTGVSPKPQPEVIGDAETQALVEATLRAFERELLGSQTSATSSQIPKVRSNEKSVTKAILGPRNADYGKINLETGLATSMVAEDYSKSEVSSTESKKKKKKKKKQKDKKRKQRKAAEKDEKGSDEDEFSKALAAMVNDVVNASLADSAALAHELPPPETRPDAAAPTVEQTIEDKQSEPEEETFDLNQIMQKAMSMAFQDQSHEAFDSSAMEEFNRGLGYLSVSDLLSGSSSLLKKKSLSKTFPSESSSKRSKAVRSKASAGTENEEVMQKRKTSSKPSLSPEEALRKRYSQAATAAAAAARKRAAARSKAERLQLRTERKKAREEKKLQKKQAKEQLEIERKELEEIVARGPPYPSDLRLTKSGKPKKPYRRWTQEEMEKRASMPPEELEKPKRVKKERKKKSKKLKKIPLSTLKKIPLFNFARDGIPADVKTKLNGIDETLKKIPLQSYQPELSKLAPPETIAPSSWERLEPEEEGAGIDRARKMTSFAFDARRKTVVRREKIPFHPPWALPTQVPYALPLARRKRKEKPRDFPFSTSGRQKISGRAERPSFSPGIRNKIIPAVLRPIISTLKAAARAKVASGASPEETNKLLMTIIRHTKKSIAESLSLARRQAARNYSAIKTENDLDHWNEIKSRKAARIPIFRLSKIKQLDTSEDTSVKSATTSILPIPIVKIEETADITPSRLETASVTSWDWKSRDNVGTPVATDGITTTTQLPSDSIKGSVGEHKERLFSQEVASEEDQGGKQLIKDQGEILGKIEIRAEEGMKAEIKEARESTKQSKLSSCVSKSVAGVEDVNNRTESQNVEYKRPPVETHGLITSSEINFLLSERNWKLSQSSKQLTALKAAVTGGSSVTKDSLQSLKDVVNKDSGGEEQRIHEVLDDLVKEHFTQSKNDPIELTDDVRHIISETIEELIPVMDVHQQEREERPKRQRKGPPPVLNLDGLVPPNNLRVIPKIESSPSPSVGKKVAPKVRKERKKADQPALLYTFNVPNFKNLQGRRTMLLKRTKEYLNEEEMTILKKEINKERKRKWREANVEKNWENDLRARLRKRANAKFGDHESIEKTKWYDDQLSKSLSEREVKQEGNYNLDDNAPDKKAGGSTNLSDNEVLNMIATTLNKLEVARILERELNEEAAGYQEQRQNKKCSMSTPAEIAVEHTDQTKQLNLQSQAASYDERVSYDGQEPHTDNEEVLEEPSSTKRPYPDDLPVTVPFVKRPKYVSTQDDK